jgi:large subunit ribosomal protein L28
MRPVGLAGALHNNPRSFDNRFLEGVCLVSGWRQNLEDLVVGAPESKWTPETGCGDTKHTRFGANAMAQVCDVCGKGPQFGNNISHAHNVTRRRWNVNLQAVKALVNGSAKRIRVCTSCIKSGKIAKA